MTEAGSALGGEKSSGEESESGASAAGDANESERRHRETEAGKD